MPPISNPKKQKIAEQILHYLFSIAPEAVHTATISKEIARDEEFTKYLLIDLKSKNLIASISKNTKGKNYLKRQRWRLTDQAFQVYKNYQPSQPIQKTAEANLNKNILSSSNYRSYIS